jgi:hypothetical protein
MRLHRVLPTKPEKIYRAFLDADALARWLPPNGFTGKVHERDARVSGATACRSRTSRPATAIRSAATTSSWCPTNACAKPTASTTPTCPASSG